MYVNLPPYEQWSFDLCNKPIRFHPLVQLRLAPIRKQLALHTGFNPVSIPIKLTGTIEMFFLTLPLVKKNIPAKLHVGHWLKTSILDVSFEGRRVSDCKHYIVVSKTCVSNI